MNRRRFIKVAALSGLYVPELFAITPQQRAAVLVAKPKPAVAGGISYLISEDFESGTQPSGWTKVGSPVFNYQPAILGTYSVRAPSEATSVTSPAFAAQSTVYCFAGYQFGAPPPVDYACIALRDGSSNLVSVGYHATGYLWISSGGIQSAGIFIPSSGTTYYIWLTYMAGTGSNGRVDMYYSIDQTKPGSPSASITNSASTGSVQYYRLIGPSTGMIVDKIRISASDIGSNP